jgi:hypothetical protein
MIIKTQVLCAITLVATVISAPAQSVGTNTITAPPLTLSPTEQEIQDIKNPFPWLSWGGDMRIRNEYFDNAESLTTSPKVSIPFGALHSQDYGRPSRRWRM